MTAGINSKKRKRMALIIKELKQKISELESLRKEKPARNSRKKPETLIEEIHVPALDALKERKTVN